MHIDGPAGIGRIAHLGGSIADAFRPRPVRRLATILTSLGLTASSRTSSVFAGTPVTNGYRDHTYGGGALRPPVDKPSRSCGTRTRAAAPSSGGAACSVTAPRPCCPRTASTSSARTRPRWNPTTNARRSTRRRRTATTSGTRRRTSCTSHRSPVPNDTDPLTAPATPDDVRVFQYTYNAATDTYTHDRRQSRRKPIAGTATTVGPDFRGGAWTVYDRQGLDRRPVGRLAAGHGQVRYS